MGENTQFPDGHLDTVPAQMDWTARIFPGHADEHDDRSLGSQLSFLIAKLNSDVSG